MPKDAFFVASLFADGARTAVTGFGRVQVRGKFVVAWRLALHIGERIVCEWEGRERGVHDLGSMCDGGLHKFSVRWGMQHRVCWVLGLV